MKTILVVDDDETFVAVLSNQLRALGFGVIENTSGTDVLRQIDVHGPVACFIDVVMEAKDGLETMTEIVMRDTRPKLIAVSSNTMYLEWAEGLGVDAVLGKPVFPQQLRELLTRLDICP
ncbi:response regulator [Nitrogeniibacter aestuarii]|uniref:response regulator n=1 Tax=Nitrogeniibacter aestuarii TaxID=2815343 RepID=UPI001D126863|nr:response regulator [Nitrogeniibacter aestuarii]